MAEKSAPILIGEKTAQQIRDAETLREQARAMFGQAEARINAIATAVREARDVPETWQVALMSDNKYYLVAPAPAAGEKAKADAPAPQLEPAAPEVAAAEPEPVEPDEPPQRKPARRAR